MNPWDFVLWAYLVGCVIFPAIFIRLNVKHGGMFRSDPDGDSLDRFMNGAALGLMALLVLFFWPLGMVGYVFYRLVTIGARR